jgi:hypothetical protein
LSQGQGNKGQKPAEEGSDVVPHDGVVGVKCGAIGIERTPSPFTFSMLFSVDRVGQDFNAELSSYTQVSAINDSRLRIRGNPLRPEISVTEALD